MDQPPYAPGPAGSNHVARALHVDPFEIGGIAEVLDLRRGMEGDLAVLDPEVVQIAHHRLRAELAHARGGLLRARQRPHVPALAPEALDQRASHEAGSAG